MTEIDATNIVAVENSVYQQLTEDSVAYRLLLQICRALVSGNFMERFSIDTNLAGEVVYQWAATEHTMAVTWTPGGKMTDVEKSLMAAGYGAMVLFPAILATLDTTPDAVHFPSHSLIAIDGPLLGTLWVRR